MKAFDKIYDWYLKAPIIIDSIVISIVWLCAKHFCLFEFTLTKMENQLSLASNIISTDVSLAGFMLAALTIIVTFKSNLKAKGIEDADNALEMIFSSGHYNSIVNVFKSAIVELCLCFTVIYIAWASSDNLSIWTINRINVSGIMVTSLALIRSLSMLFVILGLENHKKNE